MASIEQKTNPLRLGDFFYLLILGLLFISLGSTYSIDWLFVIGFLCFVGDFLIIIDWLE